MGRHAKIIDEIADVFGEPWAVREYRPTAHGFDVALGWPAKGDRGKGGAGGPRAILTPELAAYLAGLRGTPKEIDLPLGRTAIRRLRRNLGHDWYADNCEWWRARLGDLAALSLVDFAAKHGCSQAAVHLARARFLGEPKRSPGWWRGDKRAQKIILTKPGPEAAKELGMGLSTIYKAKSFLRGDGARYCQRCGKKLGNAYGRRIYCEPCTKLNARDYQRELRKARKAEKEAEKKQREQALAELTASFGEAVKRGDRGE